MLKFEYGYLAIENLFATEAQRHRGILRESIEQIHAYF